MRLLTSLANRAPSTLCPPARLSPIPSLIPNRPPRRSLHPIPRYFLSACCRSSEAVWRGGALRVLWVISGFCRVGSCFMGVSSGNITPLLWTKVWLACGFLRGERGQKGPIRGTPIFGNQVTSGLPDTRKFAELEWGSRRIGSRRFDFRPRGTSKQTTSPSNAIKFQGKSITIINRI